MGLRIEVEEGELIADALKRFRKLINANGAFPLESNKWHKKRLDYYQKPSVYRRRRRWLSLVSQRRGRSPAGDADPENEWVDDLFMRPTRAWGDVDRSNRRRFRLFNQQTGQAGVSRHYGSGGLGRRRARDREEN